MVINSSADVVMFRHLAPMLQNKRPVLVLLLFLALTLLLTYPLLLNLDNGVRDAGDPLLNSWILAWDVQKIVHLDWKGFFDANIFYPAKKTLAYSEFLFTQSLFALPVLLIWGNPILAHNVALLLGFVISGFGMYLLASSLTKNTAAGIIAGMIYAFSPFMFAHLSHLQVLSAGGIPLTFLFLHRFFARSSGRDFFLFTLFYILQALANGYYALYLTVFAGLFIAYHVVNQRKFADRRFWLKMGTFVIIVALTVGPFFYQYIRVRAEMDFSREIGFSAKLSNFLATAKINRIYGQLTRAAWSPEGELFPGAAAFLLALSGLFLGIKIKTEKRKTGRTRKAERLLPALKILLNCLILIWLGLVIAILLGHGFQLSIGNFRLLSARRVLNPLLTLAGLIFLRAFLNRLVKLKIQRILIRGEKAVLIYAGILVLAFLFTFGPKGPYYFLYKYVPGFDGLRVTSRFHVFVMFSLAVLAAFGVRAIRQRLKGWRGPLFTGLASLVILAEYFSAPVPLTKVPVKEEIPEVYRWLGSQRGENFALLEIPLPQPTQSFCVLDCPRLYFSAYHWKNLVNGFSGYSSPLYEELTRRWQKNPFRQNIEDLKILGLRYLLIHSSDYRKPDFRRIMERISGFEPDLHFVGQFENVHVFEFANWAESGTGKSLAGLRPGHSLEGSSVQTNVNEDSAGAAVDGSIETRWESGPQESGQYFQVDLGSIEQLRGISLCLGRYPEDYPRGYSVEASADGLVWREISRQENVRLPLTAYLRPKVLPLEIAFAQTEARYLRVTNLGEDPVCSWSICELGVLK